MVDGRKNPLLTKEGWRDRASPIGRSLKTRSASPIGRSLKTRSASPIGRSLKTRSASPIGRSLKTRSASPIGRSLKTRSASPIGRSLKTRSASPIGRSLKTRSASPIGRSLKTRSASPIGRSLKTRSASPIGRSLKRWRAGVVAHTAIFRRERPPQLRFQRSIPSFVRRGFLWNLQCPISHCMDFHFCSRIDSDSAAQQHKEGRNHERISDRRCDARVEFAACGSVVESAHSGHPAHAGRQAESAAPAPRTLTASPTFRPVEQDFSQVFSKYCGGPEAWRHSALGADSGPAAQGRSRQRIHERAVCAAGPRLCHSADSTGAEMMKIVQTPSLILILNPDLTYRQIFLDGRVLETAPNPSWMGYSVGHWDGDTLVVESFGFNDRTWLDHDGHPHTEALRMTERYRRRDFGNLDLEVTLSDPAVYTRPWTVRARRIGRRYRDDRMGLQRKRPGLEHWIGKASDERKGEVQVAPEILAKYVGTYVEQPPLWRTVPRVVEITVSNGRLFGDMDGRGKVP